jgi:hypothetical protein
MIETPPDVQYWTPKTCEPETPSEQDLQEDTEGGIFAQQDADTPYNSTTLEYLKDRFLALASSRVADEGLGSWLESYEGRMEVCAFCSLPSCNANTSATARCPEIVLSSVSILSLGPFELQGCFMGEDS